MTYDEIEDTIVALNGDYDGFDEPYADLIRNTAVQIKDRFDISYIAIALALVLNNYEL